MSIEQFLVTRFNVKIFDSAVEEGARAKSLRQSLKWLRGRVRMFERFCLPSIAAQTNKDFKWLIYVDDQSPNWLHERASLWKKKVRSLEIRQVSYARDTEIIQFDLVPRLLKSSANQIATTRLDSDDALHKDFMLRLRRAFEPGRAQAYNFRHGYAWHAGLVKSSKHDSSPFITVVEERNPKMRSVYFCSHIKVSKHMPVKQLDSEPLWLVTFHGDSLTHTASRGARYFGAECVPASKIAASFGLSAAAISAP